MELFKRKTCKYQNVIVRVFLLSLFLAGCNLAKLNNEENLAYIERIKKWHNERIENLKSKDGWLNLVGLFWLAEGENKMGSDSSNNFILSPDKAPPFVASFLLENNKVKIKICEGIEVYHKDSLVKGMSLESDERGNPTVLDMGSLSWFIIKRGEKIGIRLRDYESPLISQFKGIETFPVDSAWRIEANFESYETPKTISMSNVIGTINEYPSPGVLVFQIKGVIYKLYPFSNDGDLFIIFGDETSAVETYGGGRFLSVKKPNKDGKTFIDFNKAYNPPCTFTEFATCPLPPRQNRLPVRITAGEKKVEQLNH